MCSHSLFVVIEPYYRRFLHGLMMARKSLALQNSLHTQTHTDTRAKEKGTHVSMEPILKTAIGPATGSPGISEGSPSMRGRRVVRELQDVLHACLAHCMMGNLDELRYVVFFLALCRACAWSSRRACRGRCTDS